MFPHRPWLGLILGVLVTVSVIWFVAREVDWRVTWAALSRADWRYLALALGAMLASIVGKAIRWQWLFYPESPRLSRRRLLTALLIGQLGNVMLPTRLGDLARLWLVSEKQGIPWGVSLLTIVAEKAVDSLMLLLMLAVLLPVVPLPSWLGTAKLALAGLLVVALATGVGMAAHELLRQRMRQAWERLHLHWLARWLERALDAIVRLQALRAWPVQWRLWALSATIWLLSGLVNHFAFHAVRLDLPFAAGLLLTVTEISGTNVAYAPAALGVYHSICVLTLSLFGVPFAPALSAALLLYLIVYAPIVVGGLFSIWLEGFDLRQIQQEPSP